MARTRPRPAGARSSCAKTRSRGSPTRCAARGRRARHRSSAAIGRTPALGLGLAALLVALLELGQHLAAEELERLADVLVAGGAGLEHEDELVDAGLFVAAQVLAQLVGRADRAAQPGDVARLGARAELAGVSGHGGLGVVALLAALALEVGPDVGAARARGRRRRCSRRARSRRRVRLLARLRDDVALRHAHPLAVDAGAGRLGHAAQALAPMRLPLRERHAEAAHLHGGGGRGGAELEAPVGERPITTIIPTIPRLFPPFATRRLARGLRRRSDRPA
jgi:hypothetical protein